VLTTKDPDVQVDVRVRGRGFAPQNMACSAPVTTCRMCRWAGCDDHRAADERGESRGGAVVGLSQEQRGVEQDLGGPLHAMTDEAGRFTFTDVAPNQTYNIFGAMNSLRELNLLVPKHGVTTNDPGDKMDVGDLEVTSGFTLAGQIRMSDGKKIPAKTKVSISRVSMSDSQRSPWTARAGLSLSACPRRRVVLRADEGISPVGRESLLRCAQRE
jgi:hypothetical protein